MIDWDQVDTVLLDMDGTLLDLRFDNHFWLEYLPRRYAQVRRLSVEAARAELLPHMRRLEGSMQWYCLDYWSRALELDIPALKREVGHLIGFRPRAVEFLQALERAGKRRVLVTNAHRAALALKCERTELAAHLDVMISSHDFGHPKEQAGFWRALQQAVPFDPARTLLLDDTVSVLRAARDHGIRWLLGIAQPDSGQGRRQQGEFALLEDFAQIMPAAAGCSA
ncbi:MAG: GMP/IMP nucleotidase [Xanthomonadaceae bacterium]|nr:GMP/IMP nucleotidase [Xanthomonadaceae bacterium]